MRVSHCKGQPPTETYKVCATFKNGTLQRLDQSNNRSAGFNAKYNQVVVGHDAAIKARRLVSTLLTRWRAIIKAAGYDDFSEALYTLHSFLLEVSAAGKDRNRRWWTIFPERI